MRAVGPKTSWIRGKQYEFHIIYTSLLPDSTGLGEIASVYNLHFWTQVTKSHPRMYQKEVPTRLKPSMLTRELRHLLPSKPFRRFSLRESEVFGDFGWDNHPLDPNWSEDWYFLSQSRLHPKKFATNGWFRSRFKVMGWLFLVTQLHDSASSFGNVHRSCTSVFGTNKSAMWTHWQKGIAFN